jgi:RNA polymerase sigma-70 factor (ECF subfamily)
MSTTTTEPANRSGDADEPRTAGRAVLPAKGELEGLVRHAATGAASAVHALLVALGPLVLRYCRARMGRADVSYFSAEDVAQEVCLAVFKALPSYRERGGSFLGLVYAIAANKVVDAFRAASRDRSRPVLDVPETFVLENEPERRALQGDLSDRMSLLLASLNDTQREVLTLRVAVGLSAIETAEVLQMSPGAVRVTQHRALQRLRGMINSAEDL